MTFELPIVAGIVLMILALFLVPLGFPGLWAMLGVLGIGAWKGEVALWIWLGLIVVAGLAEVAEFFIVKWSSDRYGGSRKAFWGAILGGTLGILFGLPVPVPLLGPLIGGLAGTFAGAAIVTWLETRRLGQARKVAWGAIVGRGLAAAVKTAAGILILVLGSAALLIV